MKYLFPAVFILLNITVSAQEYLTNSPASVNFDKGSYDSADYSKVPVIKKLKDCFDKPFVYYFPVAGSRFRIVHVRSDSFPQVATLQKRSGNKWENRIEFYQQNHFNDLYFKDVNNDGFIDLIRNTYRDGEIYLFKPSINNFIDSVCGDLNDYVYLIDSLRNIYCDFQAGRGMSGQIYSTLYTFKNYTKYYLYHLQLYNSDYSDDPSKITKLILSKCINGQLYETEELRTYKLKKILEDTDGSKFFDNRKFWIKEYKRLSANSK